MGRPSKFNDILAQAILKGIAKGLPRVTAAKAARIAPSTLFDWLRRGRDGEEPFSDFSARLKAAEAESEAELVERIREAGKTTWQANAWLLERRIPQRWSARRLEVRAEAKAVRGTDLGLADVPLLESLLAAARSHASELKGTG